MMDGHNDKALRILESLHRRSSDSITAYSQLKFRHILKQAEPDKSLDSSWSHVDPAIVPLTYIDGLHCLGRNLQLWNTY